MSEYRAGSHNTLRYTPFHTEPTACNSRCQPTHLDQGLKYLNRQLARGCQHQRPQAIQPRPVAAVQQLHQLAVQSTAESWRHAGRKGWVNAACIATSESWEGTTAAPAGYIHNCKVHIGTGPWCGWRACEAIIAALPAAAAATGVPAAAMADAGAVAGATACPAAAGCLLLVPLLLLLLQVPPLGCGSLQACSCGMCRTLPPWPLTGTRKASVLPDPVLAAPRTSLPARAWGMVARCTAVMLVYLAPFKAALVAALIGRSSNFLTDAYCPGTYSS